MTNRRFQALEKLINLSEGYSSRFRIDHLHLLLFHRNGETHLVEATCPHRAHLLDPASIIDGAIECPAHHYRFSLQDGSLINSPGEPCRNLRVFPLVYEGSEIGIMLDEPQ
ncbi:MAG: hypothetical protein Hals2KO_00860 [Halioglobus sp.]